MPKIFCIGFQKTGTTSLEKAFQLLGYRVGGVSHELLPQLEQQDFSGIKKLADQYDVLQDNPWPVLFRQLDQLYPGSKFILTIREEHKWIKSVVNHFGHHPSKMIEYLYGVPYPAGHEDLFLSTFRAHNQAAIAYFKDRQDDLLILDLADGDLWKKICGFLHLTVPTSSFPHANKGAYTAIGRARKYVWKRIRARWRNFRSLF